VIDEEVLIFVGLMIGIVSEVEEGMVELNCICKREICVMPVEDPEDLDQERLDLV